MKLTLRKYKQKHPIQLKKIGRIFLLNILLKPTNIKTIVIKKININKYKSIFGLEKEGLSLSIIESVKILLSITGDENRL